MEKTVSAGIPKQVNAKSFLYATFKVILPLIEVQNDLL